MVPSGSVRMRPPTRAGCESSCVTQIYALGALSGEHQEYTLDITLKPKPLKPGPVLCTQSPPGTARHCMQLSS